MSNERSSAAKNAPEGPPVEGRPKPRWHAETLWCSLFGHYAPADNVKKVSARDDLVAIAVGENVHMSRCLRCDMWLLTDETTAAKESMPTLGQLQVPKRGKVLRDAIVLKVIAIDRGVHAVIFLIVFVGVLLLESHLGALQNTARHLVDNAQNIAVNNGPQAPGRNYVNKALNRFIDLKPNSLRVLLITAAAYAFIEGLESIGLWRQKRWAEYLTAIATAGFLPLEIHELLSKVTVIRLGALIINLVVLIYLLWAKRLFGIRGGVKADQNSVMTADQIPPLSGQTRLLTQVASLP